MKNCTHCKHAVWDLTTAGKLHPSGDGRCGLEYKLPPLPASKYWRFMEVPVPIGGLINRRKELLSHCAYFSMENK